MQLFKPCHVSALSRTKQYDFMNMVTQRGDVLLWLERVRLVRPTLPVCFGRDVGPFYLVFMPGV